MGSIILEVEIALYVKMLYLQVGYPGTEAAMWFDSDFIS